MNKLLTELVVDEGGARGIPDMRIGETARSILHEAAEEHIVQYFQKAVLNMVHGGRVTLKVKDFSLIDNQHFLDDGNKQSYHEKMDIHVQYADMKYKTAAPGAPGPSGGAA